MTNDSEYFNYEILSNDDTNGMPVHQERYPQSSYQDQRLNDISDFVYQHTQLIDKTLDLASQVTEVYAESQRLNAHIELANIYSKVELAKIISKFQATKLTIERVFNERQSALSEYYKALDHGIEHGDRDLIVSAMQNISSIVVTSPLSDIKNFINAFNTKDAPLLDF